MDKKKKAPTAIGARARKHDPHTYYRLTTDGSKQYRKGMGAAAAAEVHRRMFGPESEPGRASDFMQGIHKFVNLHSDLEVYIIVRESGENQQRSHNHDNYTCMETGCGELGIPVRACIRVTRPGKIVESEWRDIVEDVALRAYNRAAKTGKTVAILMYSADRFLRNARYWKMTPKLLPTRWEYRQQKRLTHGVPLLTWLDPDTPPLKARGLQSKLGQQTKGNKGGRPKKLSRAERKDLLRPQVLQLRQDTGRGCCWIAKQMGLSSKTVWEWLKEDA